jgi:hypothetical protein
VLDIAVVGSIREDIVPEDMVEDRSRATAGHCYRHKVIGTCLNFN